MSLVTYLAPANEVCEGYVFTGVCLSTGGGLTDTPPLGRRSTSQRYASYWNAILLHWCWRQCKRALTFALESRLRLRVVKQRSALLFRFQDPLWCYEVHQPQLCHNELLCCWKINYVGSVLIPQHWIKLYGGMAQAVRAHALPHVKSWVWVPPVLFVCVEYSTQHKIKPSITPLTYFLNSFKTCIVWTTINSVAVTVPIMVTVKFTFCEYWQTYRQIGFQTHSVNQTVRFHWHNVKTLTVTVTDMATVRVNRP